MIERTKYKNQLINTFRKTEVEKNYQVLCLTGSEKTGKTQLLNSTFSALKENIFETTFFKGNPSPLAPIVQFLRHLIEQKGLKWLDSNPIFQFLSGFLPELEMQNYKPDFQTQVLAVAETIKFHCSQSPIIWIIDHSHWMDEESANFLSPLIRNLKGNSVLIIFSGRKTVFSDLPMNQLSADLQHQANYSELEISPFNVHEIIQLADVGFTFSISKENSQSLLNFTGGNPFFLCEIFKSLSTGQIEEKGFNPEKLINHGHLKLPRAILQTIVLKLKEVQQESVIILKTAALYGYQFEMELLESACNNLSAIDDLIQQEWIVLIENGEGLGKFQNKLVYHSILNSISWSEKKWAAEKIARFLDGKYHVDKAALSGDFWKTAGNKENARKAYMQASSNFCQKKEYKAAVISAKKALALWPPEVEPALKAELLENMADCARHCGMREVAIFAFQELLASGLFEEKPQKKAFISRSLAICCSQTSMWNDYKTLRIEAAELFRSTALYEEAAIEFHELSNRSFDEINAPEGIKFIKQAIECAKKGNNLERQIRSEAQLAYLMAIAGNGEEALPLIEKTLEKALESQFVEAIAYVYRKFAGILEYNSDFTNSIQTYNKVLDYCKTQNLPVQSQLCVSCMSWVFFRLGEWKKSIEACQTVIDDKETHAQSKALAFLILALIKIYRGELKSAENYLHKSEGLALTSGFELVSFMLLWPKALYREYKDETESAQKYFQSLQDTWYQKEDVHDILGGLFDALTFYIKTKNVKNCNAIVVILTKILTKTPNKEVQACLSYGLGGIAFLADNLNEAENYFSQTQKMFFKLNMPLQSNHAEFLLGKVLLERNEVKKGYSKIQNAFNMAKNAGMRGIISNWDEVKKPVTLSEGQLTKRQMDILFALKDGLSNKEIAAKHHLSTRTVDMHVSNILERLNCRNRTEAINIAQSLGIIG